MKLFKQDTFADGDIVTPHELNAELRTQLGELNGGLDIENFESDALTHSDLDPDDDPWMTYSGVEETSPQSFNPGSGRDQYHKVPTNSAYSQVSFTAQEGVLTVHSTLLVTSDTDLWTWTLAIRVDGHVVAESGCSTAGETSGRHIVCAVPVAAGTREVEALIRTAEVGADLNIVVSQLHVFQFKV